LQNARTPPACRHYFHIFFAHTFYKYRYFCLDNFKPQAILDQVIAGFEDDFAILWYCQ